MDGQDSHTKQENSVNLVIPSKTMFEADNALGYVIMKKLSDIISKRRQKRTEKLIETWVEAFEVDEI